MNNSRANVQLAKESDQQLHLPSYNAALEFARSRGVAVGDSFSEEPFGHVKHPEVSRQRELWWPCVSDEAADAFSVIEVYDATAAGTAFYFKVRRATAAAKLYAGNEDYPLFQGGMGWIKLITPYEPITVIASDLSVAFLTTVGPDGADKLTTVTSGLMQTLTRPEVGTGKVGVIALTGSSSSSTTIMTNTALVTCQQVAATLLCPVCPCSVDPWILTFPDFGCYDTYATIFPLDTGVPVFFDAADSSSSECLWKSGLYSGFSHVFQWVLTVTGESGTTPIAAITLLKDTVVILTWSTEQFCCACITCFDANCNTVFPLPCPTWPAMICLEIPSLKGGTVTCPACSGQIAASAWLVSSLSGFIPNNTSATLTQAGTCSWSWGYTQILAEGPTYPNGMLTFQYTLTLVIQAVGLQTFLQYNDSGGRIVNYWPLYGLNCTGTNTFTKVFDSAGTGGAGHVAPTLLTVAPTPILIGGDGNPIEGSGGNPIGPPSHVSCMPGACQCCFLILLHGSNPYYTITYLQVSPGSTSSCTGCIPDPINAEAFFLLQQFVNGAGPTPNGVILCYTPGT